MDILGQIANNFDAEDPHTQFVGRKIFKKQILVLVLPVHHVNLTMVKKSLLKVHHNVLDHNSFQS